MEADSIHEDFYKHGIYLEFTFEEWPLLAALNEGLQQRLCAKVSDALAAVACKVQAIRATSDVLQLILQLDANVSMDNVANIVTAAGRSIAADPDAEEPVSYSVESLSPEDVLNAVLRLRSWLV